MPRTSPEKFAEGRGSRAVKSLIPPRSKPGWADYSFGRAPVRCRLVDAGAGPQCLVEYGGQALLIHHFLQLYEAVEVTQPG